MNNMLRITGAFGYSLFELFIVAVVICLVIYVLFRLLGK